jgi:DNA-binding response OmpR family regulator
VKRVLIVERDSLHRELLCEWLVEGGVQAVCAQAVAGAPAGIDAVLIDVTCQQQAHEILGPWRHAYPHASLVALSGRFHRQDQTNDAMAARLGVTRILAKPFTRDDLWAALGLELQPTPAPRPR